MPALHDSTCQASSKRTEPWWFADDTPYLSDEELEVFNDIVKRLADSVNSAFKPMLESLVKTYNGLGRAMIELIHGNDDGTNNLRPSMRPPIQYHTHPKGAEMSEEGASIARVLGGPSF